MVATLLVLLGLCLWPAVSADKQDAFVHLRTGRVNVAALESRFVAQRRSLRSSLSKHKHHTDELWGPLGQHTQYLLAMGEEWAGSTRQQELLQLLHADGAVVTAFLPPRSWLLSALPSVAAMLADTPGLSVAPLPAKHKVAPEWDTVHKLVEGEEHVPDVMLGAEVGQRESGAASQTPLTEASSLLLNQSAEERVDSITRSSGSSSSSSTRSSSTSISGSSSTRTTSGSEASDEQGHVGATAERDEAGVGSEGCKEAHCSPLLKSLRLLKPSAEADGTESGGAIHSRILYPEDLNKYRSNSVDSSTTHDAEQGTKHKKATSPFPEGSKMLIHVHFPYLEKADLKRLGLVNPILQAPMAWENSSRPNPSDDGGQASDKGSYSPALAATKDWPPALNSLGRSPGCEAEVILDAHESVMVAVCPQDVRHTIAWLSSQPSVKWLSPVLHAHLHNLLASAITQTGQFNQNSDPTSLANHPLWRANIDGTGQVVGCGDSGLDIDSCYFYDNSVPFPTNLGKGGRFTSTTHRKVVQYLAIQDAHDGLGHGTHVVGTILGSALGASSPDMATGMAPGAKVSFLDLTQGRSSSIWTPGDLASAYFPLSYAVGARIHSDSWGSDITVYDSMAASVDRFTWNNQDFLPVIAAGNFGALSSYLSTITSPGTSKNGITVGATLNYQSRYSSSATMPVYNAVVTISIAGRQVTSYHLRVAQASFSGQLSSLNGESYVVVPATPQNACTSLANSMPANAVVLATRGGCSGFGMKLRHAQNAGASAMILTNDRAEGYFSMASNSAADTDLRIPLANIPMDVGSILWTAIQAGQSVSIRFNTSPSPANKESYEDVASFSSFGPTPDGRVKPDIVAPGVLVSAGSIGLTTGNPQGCGTLTMQGTSMATPVVAGSAALVRQYFADGFYPTGSKTPANQYPNPSGALVKAVLLGGAASMTGNVMINFKGAGPVTFPLERSPSYRQGFGRINVGNSLPLAAASNGWRMQVVDMAELEEGEVHEYCVQAIGGGALRVTLVWHDYPADVAASKVLVNDLNLQLRAVGLDNQVLLGNGVQDSVNNVESIQLETIAPGNVAITVRAETIFAKGGPQKYALVVLGSFEGVLQSPHNPVGASSDALTVGSCIEVLVQINDVLSTKSPTSSEEVSFFFKADAVVPLGYECTLMYTSTGDTNGGPAGNAVHNWRVCTSPYASEPLADGSYTFMVRARGQKIANSRTVVVDNIPPISMLATSPALSLPVGGKPSTLISSDSIAFIFSSQDVSPVTYRCTLLLKNGPDPPFFRSNIDGLDVNKVVPCTSPVTLQGLFYGDWTFSVQGVDAAGNAEGSNAPRGVWGVRFLEGQVYSRIVSSPPKVTNNSVLQYSLVAFQGSGDGIPELLPATTQYEYKLWEQADIEPAQWTPSPGKTSVQAPSDGVYTFKTRVLSQPSDAPDAEATMQVHVDTSPPKMEITQAPPEFQSNPIVTVSFITDPPDDATRYLCRWQHNTQAFPASDAPDSGPTAYKTCTGGLSPDSAALNVTEGYWIFQVRGEDAAGNLSPPLDVFFRTDLQPPKITQMKYPAFTNKHEVTVSFELDDGQLGSGISTSTCSMRATFLPSDGMAPLEATLNGSYSLPDGVPIQPCDGGPINYNFAEGNYTFNVQVTDQAGLQTQVDYYVVVDLSPPTVVITSPLQSPGTYLPGGATVDFIVRDFPDGSASGLGSAECFLRKTDGFTTARRSLLSQASAYLNLGQPQHTRQLSAVVDNFPFNSWHPCSSPVQYNNMETGFYDLQVRATDRAGNLGVASDMYAFTVDGSGVVVVPSPGGSEGGSGSSNDKKYMIIGIVAGVGALLIIIAVITLVVVRKRKLRQQSANHQGMAYPLPPPTPTAPPPPGAYGGPKNNSYGGYVSPYAVSYGAQQSYAGQPSYSEPPANGTPYSAPPRAAAPPPQVTHSENWQRSWEDDRVRQAIQASIEVENIRKATEASHREAEQAALRASLASSTNNSSSYYGNTNTNSCQSNPWGGKQ